MKKIVIALLLSLLVLSIMGCKAPPKEKPTEPEIKEPEVTEEPPVVEEEPKTEVTEDFNEKLIAAMKDFGVLGDDTLKVDDSILLESEPDPMPKEGF